MKLQTIMKLKMPITLINMTPVLPPRQNSYLAGSEVSRRSGREHKLPGKYLDFVVPTRGLPKKQSASQASGSSTGPGIHGKISGITASPTEARSSAAVNDPFTHQEALSREDSERWKVAMEEEYQSLLENEIWTLTDHPKGRKAIKCKWGFKTKHDVKKSSPILSRGGNGRNTEATKP